MISSSNMKKKKKYETALAAIFPENDQSYSQYSQGDVLVMFMYNYTILLQN